MPYALLATGWIFLSDHALGLLAPDHERLLAWGTAKGIAYVTITTLLLLVLMWRAFAAVERSIDALAAKSRALRANKEQLASVVRTARDGIITIDEGRRIVMVNPAAEKMLACSSDEAVGHDLDLFLADPLPEGDETTMRLAIRGDEERPPMSVEGSTARAQAADRELRTIILRDIAERRAYEQEIERLNHLYAALSHINQAIVRSATPNELLERACRALGVHGGLRRVWIALREEEDQVRIGASATWGDDDGFIEELEMPGTSSSRDDGPGAQALRRGRPFISNSVAVDFARATWRRAAERRGLQACAAFPMRKDRQIVGVLGVFADTPGFFRDREIELLGEAAIDLSFALEHLEHQARRRRAEELAETERRFSNMMIESMPGIMYFYDQEGRFLRWNRNFEEVSGYTSDEIARMSPLEFFEPDVQPLLVERIGAVFEQGEATVEAPFRRKNGETTPYFFTGRRIEHRGEPCLVGVGIDISQRVAAEAALRELAATLELRVAERTDELATALVRAEDADRLKSAFLATMSHELRTPLNSIIGFTGILLQGLAGPLNEEQGRQLGMVRTSARHLLALINDVLDLSKIEAGQLEIRAEPFDLRAAIDQSVAAIRPIADAKSLAVEVTVSPGVSDMVGDRRRVEQILLNLLTNAIKFTDRGRVRLTAETIDETERGPCVKIVVSDTGIGIAPADLESLFQPFRQVDTGLSRQHEGTGLGLAICRRLVGLMDGAIDATSDRGVGSAFTVVLPTALESGRRLVAPQGSSASSSA